MAKLAFGSTEWINFGRMRWILVSTVIMASALGTYLILLLTGGDPAWSISEALKWCDKIENIHIDTMPF
jgi:glucose-6-phosphatase